VMKRERKDQGEILRFAQNGRVFTVSGCPSADRHARLLFGQGSAVSKKDSFSIDRSLHCCYV
jgi:hypothetical protein